MEEITVYYCEEKDTLSIDVWFIMGGRTFHRRSTSEYFTTVEELERFYDLLKIWQKSIKQSNKKEKQQHDDFVKMLKNRMI